MLLSDAMLVCDLTDWWQRIRLKQRRMDRQMHHPRLLHRAD